MPEPKNVLRALRALSYEYDLLLDSEQKVRANFGFQNEPCVDGACHEKRCTHILVEVKGINFLKAVSQVRHCIERLKDSGHAVREAVLVMRGLKGSRGKYTPDANSYLVDRWTSRRFKIEGADVRYIERLD